MSILRKSIPLNEIPTKEKSPVEGIHSFHEIYVLQIRISVSDQGQPPRTATNQAVVNITIIRNQQAPIFFNSEYSVTIQETASIGSNVQTVSASDADTSVCILYCILYTY